MHNETPVPAQISGYTYEELESPGSESDEVIETGRANREELPGETYQDTPTVSFRFPDRMPIDMTSKEATASQYFVDSTETRKIVSRYGDRARVTVYNTEDSGGENAWIGFSQGIDSANGFLLKPDKAIVLETAAEIYAIGTSTGCTLCILTERF